MAVRFSTGLRNKILGTSGLSAALANGVIHIYSGSQPANADSAISGVLLGTVTVDGAAFTPGAATNGLVFDTAAAGAVSKPSGTNWKFTGLANGTAGWFRFVGNATDDTLASTTLPRIDGAIAKTGGDLTLSNTAITSGAPSTIDVFQLTMAAN